MSQFLSKRRRSAKRAAWATSLSALFLLGLVLTIVSGAAAAAASVPLGTAGSFAVLAGAGITNTGPTTVNGDLGTYPDDDDDRNCVDHDERHEPCRRRRHAGCEDRSRSRRTTTAAGEGPTSPISADLAGQTLTPGSTTPRRRSGSPERSRSTAAATRTRSSSSRRARRSPRRSGSTVNLINGAQSCNVFWQVGSSATLGTGSTFRGTILALTSITVTTGVPPSTAASSPGTARSRSIPTRSRNRPARHRPPRPRRRLQRPRRQRPRPRRDDHHRADDHTGTGEEAHAGEEDDAGEEGRRLREPSCTRGEPSST